MDLSEQLSLFNEEYSESDGFSSLEICAGAGGQALGLEMAGFKHRLLVEYEKDYCQAIKRNRPEWDVRCADVRNFSGTDYRGQIDLLSGGVPCPPFSVAGKQLGQDDERDLFPEMLRLVDEIRPKAVMIENVRGLLDQKFTQYREAILNKLNVLGYNTHIKLLQASDFGVSQLRPRVIIVGIRKDLEDTFEFPLPDNRATASVGELLCDLMGVNGWEGTGEWKAKAAKIAPTLVGGSKKHGGPDLGPTRAKREWANLGIDGKGVANEAPEKGFDGLPRLTVRMLARIQGFPDTWDFGTKKTLACRMIGNAFPPPVAKAVGEQIFKILLNNASFNRVSEKTVS